MELEQQWRTVEAERLALADLVEGLPPEAWDVASLCDGWRVRDVVAHVTLSTRVRPLTAAAGLVRARGDFNRYVATDARARAERPTAELVAELRAAAASRRHPPGTRAVDPLVDVLVHGQDVAVPLGLEHPVPGEAAAASADRLWSMGFPFHARKRCAGVRLRATDVAWERGSGPEAAGPIADVLLVLAGRRAGLDGLAGPGAVAVGARMPDRRGTAPAG